MIETVTFRNFKALREADVKLSRCSLIIGPNASGKTSVLEGVHYLSQLGRRPASEVFQGVRAASRLRSAGSDGAVILKSVGTESSITVEMREVAGTWSHDITLFDGPTHIALPSPALYENFAGTEFARRIRSCVLLRLDPNKMADAAWSDEKTPRVEFDGTNLAAALADLATGDPDRFSEVRERMRSIIPNLRNIKLPREAFHRVDYEPVQGRLFWDMGGQPLELVSFPVFRSQSTKYVGHAIELEYEGGVRISGREASEGTLLTLGLLTVLISPNRPRLILIDELERGLHPRALGDVVKHIREIQSTYPDLQVVATTHSPYLVDHFEPNELIITSLRDDGTAAVACLSDHPDIQMWKEEMRPGEFWSAVGEEWVKNLPSKTHA